MRSDHFARPRLTLSRWSWHRIGRTRHFQCGRGVPSGPPFPKAERSWVGQDERENDQMRERAEPTSRHRAAHEAWRDGKIRRGIDLTGSGRRSGRGY